MPALLSFLPGGKAVTTAAQATRSGITAAVGQKGYNRVRGNASMGYALTRGFLPNPFMWKTQIGLYIFFLIFCISVLDLGAKSIIAAYFLQAMILTYITYRATDKVLTYGLGV